MYSGVLSGPQGVMWGPYRSYESSKWSSRISSMDSQRALWGIRGHRGVLRGPMRFLWISCDLKGVL